MDNIAPIAAELPFDDSERADAPASAPRVDRRASPGSAASAAVAPAMDPKLTRRGFAGFTYGQLLIGALYLGAAIWGMWATSKIFALEDRRVVSVRLAAIVNDFVSAEARSGTPPEQLSARTRAFMLALDTVLKKRAAGGQVVLVGEAVVASSVPDVTNEVVADLSKIVRRSAPAAMPPAMTPWAPTVLPTLQGATPAGAPLPASDAASSSPFGLAPSQLTEAVPQQ